MDDEREALYRSLVEERILLLGRLKAHKDRWDKVLELSAHPTAATKLLRLVKIHSLAEEALAL